MRHIRKSISRTGKNGATHAARMSRGRNTHTKAIRLLHGGEECNLNHAIVQACDEHLATLKPEAKEIELNATFVKDATNEAEAMQIMQTITSYAVENTQQRVQRSKTAWDLSVKALKDATIECERARNRYLQEQNNNAIAKSNNKMWNSADAATTASIHKSVVLGAIQALETIKEAADQANTPKAIELILDNKRIFAHAKRFYSMFDTVPTLITESQLYVRNMTKQFILVSVCLPCTAESLLRNPLVQALNLKATKIIMSGQPVDIIPKGHKEVLIVV